VGTWVLLLYIYISELIIARSMESYCVCLRWTRDLVCVMEVGRCGFMGDSDFIYSLGLWCKK